MLSTRGAHSQAESTILPIIAIEYCQGLFGKALPRHCLRKPRKSDLMTQTLARGPAEVGPLLRPDAWPEKTMMVVQMNDSE
jgi:hypothetical protein